MVETSTYFVYLLCLYSLTSTASYTEVVTTTFVYDTNAADFLLHLLWNNLALTLFQSHLKTYLFHKLFLP